MCLARFAGVLLAFMGAGRQPLVSGLVLFRDVRLGIEALMVPPLVLVSFLQCSLCFLDLWLVRAERKMGGWGRGEGRHLQPFRLRH